MLITKYDISSDKLQRDHTLIMLSDLHNKPYKKILKQVKAENPECILIAGDLVDRHRRTWRRVIPFLKSCTEIAPTFMSLGNHEVKFPKISTDQIRATGVILLDNEFTSFDELTIGGQRPIYLEKPEDMLAWLHEFEAQQGFKLLLSHHPEYYEKYLKGRSIDLILSGHAHGGQFIINTKRHGKVGVFAPGQGLFAHYVHGMYGNMLVGAGLANTVAPFAPRINNPCEIIRIDLHPGS